MELLRRMMIDRHKEKPQDITVQALERRDHRGPAQLLFQRLGA